MDIVRGVARYRDPALLDLMLILAMTAARAHVPPSIVFDQLYQIPDLHLVPSSILSLRKNHGLTDPDRGAAACGDPARTRASREDAPAPPRLFAGGLLEQ